MNLASFTSGAATRDRLRYLLSRLRERLWVKPLIACVLSVAGVLLANLADSVAFSGKVPSVSQDSIIALLKIIAASMLTIATFAVASMMAAYASAGQIATARAFPLIVADDVSQNALSSYIGAFIFSIVALIAAMNGYYGRAGRFTLFVLMLAVLVLVVLTFVHWVDRIARLGRVGAITGRVERATAEALARRREQPHLGGLAASGTPRGSAFHSATVGYVQRIDLATLQRLAEKCGASVTVAALPGTFVGPTRPLGYLLAAPGSSAAPASEPFAQAFIVGPQRQFDDDPRFGLLALSEIACRALSPGVNEPVDPGAHPKTGQGGLRCAACTPGRPGPRCEPAGADQTGVTVAASMPGAATALRRAARHIRPARRRRQDGARMPGALSCMIRPLRGCGDQATIEHERHE